MPRIVRFHETGSAGVLKIEDLPLTFPGEVKVRLKVEAIGDPVEKHVQQITIYSSSE